MKLRPRPFALALVLFALALVLGAGLAAAQPAPAPAPGKQAAPPAIVPPEPLTKLVADYPEGARGDASVIVVVVVNADGSVRSAHTASGAEPFASAAVRASAGWR